MPAWIAGIQVRKDASGDIHVNLDSSTPCWNDAIEGVCARTDRVPLAPIFSKECFMSLGSPAEDENGGISLQATANVRRGFCPSAASVMPAWIAGIQVRRMRPDTSMSTWVPAVHAGTTNSYCDVYATYANLMATVPPPPAKFSKERSRSLRVRISEPFVFFVPPW